jgi:ABC-type uncharacterized transport system involved in gliding motility auxiliary subunit
MANSSISARQTKYGAFVFVYVVVVLAVIIAANWLADHRNKSVDVTANKQFTLSDETKKVTGNLKKDVTIYYFGQNDSYDRARDMLDRYKNLSSKIKVDYVDPVKTPLVARAEGARAMGDIVVDNGDKRETAKGLTEEELTGALVRVSKTGMRTVCFLTGSGERTPAETGEDGYSSFKDALEKNNYTTDTVSLVEKKEVPKNCTVVVSGGPKNDYSSQEIDALRTYIQGGGHAIFGLDAVLNFPEQQMGNTPALAKLISEWGITPNGDMILDVNSALGQQAPVVETYEQHPIVSVMSGRATIFPLTRSLDVKSPAQKLFSTSEDTYSLINPTPRISKAELDKAKKGPLVLGAAATVGTGSNQGRIVVVGSSSWLANNIFPAPVVGNRDLALNMTNWLTADEDLISIRPKNPEDRRMNASPTALKYLFFSSVIVMPLIVIFSGVSVWWKRR